jgi:hypothetical protein
MPMTRPASVPEEISLAELDTPDAVSVMVPRATCEGDVS